MYKAGKYISLILTAFIFHWSPHNCASNWKENLKLLCKFLLLDFFACPFFPLNLFNILQFLCTYHFKLLMFLVESCVKDEESKLCSEILKFLTLQSVRIFFWKKIGKRNTVSNKVLSKIGEVYLFFKGWNLIC